jgi:dethiobiotin synthetase
MLTVREIARSGCKLAGWVANCIDPDMALSEQNIADLQQRITAPCLGVVSFNPENQQQLGMRLVVELINTSGCNTA